MQREAFDERLNRLLDLRQSPEDDEQLQAEALLDEERRERLVAQRLVLDGLAASEIPDVPADFAQRTVARLRVKMPITAAPKGGRWSSNLLPVLAAACAAMLLASAAALWIWPGGEDGSPELAVLSPAAGGDEVPEVDPSERAASPPAPGVDGAPRQLAGFGVGEPPEAFPHHPADIEPPAQRYQDIYRIIAGLSGRGASGDGAEHDLLAMRPPWVDEVASSLRPVAASVGGAISTLRRNLPPSDGAEPAEKPQARRCGADGRGLA